MQQDFEKRFLSQHNASPPGSKTTTPQTSPTKPGDRFIPVRLSIEEQQLRFSLLKNDETERSITHRSGGKKAGSGNRQNQQDKSSEEGQLDQRAHRALLRNELLKAQIDDLRADTSLSAPGSAVKRSPALKKLSLTAPNSGNNMLDLQNVSPGLAGNSSSLFRYRSLTYRSPAKRSLHFEDDDNAPGPSNPVTPNSANKNQTALSEPPCPKGQKSRSNSRSKSRERPGSAKKSSKLMFDDIVPIQGFESNSTKQCTTGFVMPSIPASFDHNLSSGSSVVQQWEAPSSSGANSRILGCGRNLDPLISDTVALASLTATASGVGSPYALSPLSQNSQRLLRSPRKPSRKIPRNPYKVLDAPELQDDFYLNLIDWSSQNILAVGLGSCVYLWNAWNSNVSKLCDLSDEEDTVTSVEWSEKGDFVAVGTQKGLVGIWEPTTQKRTSNLSGHTYRVGCLAWNGDLICSGSRDRFIIQRDSRAPDSSEKRMSAHKQEVCGMKWSPDRQYLASGGNDNQLLVWTVKSSQPVQTYTDHVAAVKALAWSPHHHGLLVSGGGTADRCLRFWNTLTAQSMQCFDTGSQICNVAWSKHSNELVTTHGYSSQNQIVIWKYPSLKQVVRLHGHTYRVLYLAISPDGESIVTGAGDETLRFWHVFSKMRSAKEMRSKLSLSTGIR